MITLFLDTCHKISTVSLYKETTCLAISTFESNHNLSSLILPTIDKLIRENVLRIDDINKIVVANGPGSFTGIRVGVTIAKTLAWTKQIPIYAVSSLELMASTNTNKEYIVPFIDARREYVYAAMFDHEKKNILPEKYISKAELLENIKEITPLEEVEFVSYDQIDDISSIKPTLEIAKILEKYKGIKPIDPHQINPNYLKRVEAEEKLND